MKIGNRNFRAQSAMEYLMTYGWAILIIAVVLAALYSLNVFNAGASLGGGNPCIGQSGISCSKALLTSTGLLSFTIGNGGASIFNAVFSCVATSNSVSPTSLAYNTLTSTGVGNTIAIYPGTAGNDIVTSANITNSQTLSISGVQCWPTTGTASSTFSPIGTSFTGQIWMAYNPTSATSPVNQYVKIATIAVKSSS